jgi:hypothetical protein
MTLIVGVKCSDGIVLGADSATTQAAPLGQNTIRQDTATKLHIAHSRIVLGCSGPVSLSQSYSAEVDDYLVKSQHRVRWRNVEEAKTALTKMFWDNHARLAWERASVVAKTVGPGAAMTGCNHSTATAFAIGDHTHLLEFTPECHAEEVTENVPFVAIGSGKLSADPFLAFLRRIFWPTVLPSLADGELAAIWTVDQVIRTDPGGVAGNVQVVTLKRDKNEEWRCVQLSENEIGAHRELIADMEGRMRAATASPTVEAIPTPPEPAA